MAYNGWESVRDKFQNKWMGMVTDLAAQAIRDTEIVGNQLFPRITHWEDTIDDTYNLRLLSPAPYKQWGGSTYVDNTPDRTTTTSLDAATKAIARHLDPRKFKWVGQAGTVASQQWRELQENVEKLLANMAQQIEITNEKEAWDYLTVGTLTTLSGSAFTLPIHGITNLSPTIAYHTRKSWFDNTGNVVTSATIDTDMASALSYCRLNHFDKITSIWMNSTTFQALEQNTKLSNTGGDQWWEPLSTLALKGKLINWNDRNKIQLIGTLKPHGLKVFLNDSFYRTAGGVQTMFLPDYYVVYTGDTIGKRYVLPNEESFMPERYVKSWINLPPTAPNLNFTIGETSMCYPDNRGNPDPTTGLCTWKSHYTQYVKAA